MVSPCLRKCQNTRENSQGTWPRTVACFRRLTEWSLPFSHSKVSVSPTSSHQIMLVNVMAMNDTLQSTCLTLCHVEREVLWKQRMPRLLFLTHLLSDYFLLSAYFLAVSCYKCMHLTTSAYGMHGYSELPAEVMSMAKTHPVQWTLHITSISLLLS